MSGEGGEARNEPARHGPRTVPETVPQNVEVTYNIHS